MTPTAYLAVRPLFIGPFWGQHEGNQQYLSSIWDRIVGLAQYTVGMKKHHKITASERDQIAWWLAYRVTIREMARRLGRSMQGTQLPDILEVFTAHITEVDPISWLSRTSGDALWKS
jgi:hypothetical protein